MNRKSLYGINCCSDISLFPAPTGEGGELTLLLAESAGAELALGNTAPLVLLQAHGRSLDVLTDNPEWGPSRPGQPWCIRVQDVVNFHWCSGACEMHYERQAEIDDDLVAFWFVHIVLPLYLTIEHRFDFIHAAAVEVGGAAVLFVAPSTGGKSTLADYFLQQGHAMLSDDKVRTLVENGEFMAQPAHPHHRPYRRFEDLGQSVVNFCSEKLPIAAIYCLEGDAPDSDITFTEISGFEKFELLSPNYLYPMPFLQKERLRHLGSMLHATPVYRLTRPWCLSRQQEVYQSILRHLASS